MRDYFLKIPNKQEVPFYEKKYSGETQRINLTLEPKTVVRLDWTMEQTEARSWGEVVKNLLLEKEKRLKDGVDS